MSAKWVPLREKLQVRQPDANTMQAEAGQSWMELITVALAGVGGTAKRI
jgi:hypothetical protein